MFQNILKKNRAVLVHSGNFSHFKDYLIQENLLTWREIEDIEVEPRRYQQIGRCLDIIERKTDRKAEQFLETLKTEDENLYKQLDLSISPADLVPARQCDDHKDSSATNRSLDIIKLELKGWYINTLSRFRPIPWVEWLELELGHVFTNLDIVPGRKHELTPRKSTEHMNTPAIVSMFNEDSDERSVCFVEGPAGIGKSTLCRQLAFLWSKNNFSIHEKYFDLALLLEARSLTGNLMHCVSQQLFPEDFVFPEDEIYECLQKHQETCLIIIDGVDELTDEGKTTVLGLLKGEKLRDVNLLLTGRPEASRQFVEYAHSHFKLKGFSDENVKEYICKYFLSEENSLKNGLLSRLKTDSNLLEIMNNPFTTLLVCLLVQDQGGNIPLNLSEIQLKVLQACCRKYINRTEDSTTSGLTEEKLLSAAADLAFHGLKLEVSVFTENDLATYSPNGFNEHLLKSGILSKDFTVSRLSTETSCFFPHKSFQELLCAKHISELPVEEMLEKLESLGLRGIDVNMLRFLLAMLRYQIAQSCFGKP